MKISFCIITKNEIENLTRCIDSIRSLAYEIIVVDTGSTDNTLETLRARKDNAIKIFGFEWVQDFAKARNYSLSKATGDYIIVIDSDEWITPIELEKIPRALSLDYDYYYCKQVSNRKDNLKSFVRNVRIFKNNIGIEYYGMLHESVEFCCQQKGLKPATIDLSFEHSGYDLTVEEFDKKLDRNIEISLKQLEVEPENQRVFMFLANCFFAKQKYSLAMEYASISLICKDMPTVAQAGTCILMHNILKAVDRFQSGIEFLKRSINLVPIQFEARWLYCSAMYDLKEYQECLNQLEQVKKIRIENKETNMNNDRVLTIDEINEKIIEVQNLIKQTQYKETA